MARTSGGSIPATASSAVEMFEDSVPPHWRIRCEHGHVWAAEDVTIVTERPDGSRQSFAFADRGDYLESIDKIAEPHEFMARVSLSHDGHWHDYDLAFVKDHDHGHDHIHEELRGLDVSSGGYEDAQAAIDASRCCGETIRQNMGAQRMLRPDAVPQLFTVREVLKS